jgi:hypothetical protein
MTANEGTALLARKKPTPLPKFQLFILLWVQLAEPLALQVIYPFINKVCRVSTSDVSMANVRLL